MAMFHRTLDSRSMELEPEFSDALLSPHPIELSESPEAAAGEEAGLWGRDDGEVGEAADAVDGTEYSQLVGSPAEHPTASAGDEEEVLVSESTAAPGDGMVGEEAVQAGVVETEPPAGLGAGKRKRGRPPKSQGGRAQVGRPPVKRKEKEEEEVCFICFDGGSLVVCDRRGCPKVYHPACVNRDENFFHSRGRWNCGWHICSICQKSAHYMCYTCTYSLCKGCIREAEFVCIRGSKGFCGTCHRTTMLIESNEVGADFDDENSWEHLFKIYWLDLKRKLSLTREELSTAKNPWKGYGAVTRNENSSDESYNANDDQEVSSDSSSERRVGSNSSKKKVRRRFRNAAADESSVKQVDNERASTTEDTDWASKELLEFVAHMKDGGTPILSQFDVQALLLEYIKQNNLRDPRRKSQIICDLRLKNLFGKARVGHFEMLKLLESHFLLKEASQIVTDDNHEGIVDPDYSQMDAEGYSDAATKITFDKRRKSRKRVEEREPQTNLEDYAAIDIHNINLIYLRRNLMEDLIDDIDKFNEKVVGAFVRIRISGTGQRQDLYRLVQVVGTHTAAEKYKIGKKTTYITLEILNLKKLEVITIDTISNQEFTEEECKRLRQSIKCGLIHPLTVGEVQEKARVLQAVRVSDWLESEKLRLGHLRDRASEKGRRKELRECVEKLQILNTPEERRRRLNEIPEIHTDSNMDPRYESADEGESDGKDQDNYGRSRESFSLRKRREALSSGKGGAIPSNNWNEARRSSNAAWEMNRSTLGDGVRENVELINTIGDRTNESPWTQGKDVRNSGWGPPSTTSTQAGDWDNNQTAAKPEQSYAAAPETAPMLQPTGISAPSNTSEADKIWHYLDPSGKVQGPFSMTQMRKWSTTGFFPPDLRIWRESERQDEAVFLTGALVGKFQKDPPQREPQHNSFSQSTSFPPSWVDNNQNRVVQWNAGASFPAADSTGLTNAGRLASQSTAWSAPRAELANPMEGRIGLTGWETPRVPNAWPAQPQTYSAPRPTAPFPGNYYQPPPPYQGRGGRGGGNAGRWNQGQDRGGAWNSNRPVGPRPGGPGYERQQPNWSSPGQQSSGEPWKLQPANESRNQWGNDSFNPPSPTPQPSSGGWANVQGAVNTSMSFHRAGPGLGTAPSTAATMEPNKAAANSVGGWGSSAASNAASNQKGKADGWGSWTAASASMPDKAKKAEAVNGWDSWSAASASRPDKTKMAEPVDASTIPERFDALVGSHTSSQQKEPSESDAPAILGNQSTLLWEGMNGSDCSAAMGSPTSKKNQFLQDDCPSPTPLSERQDLSIVQSNELDPLPAMEDKLISPATSTKPTAKSESQGWGRASSQEQNGPSLGTPPSENREQNQNQKLNSCNWQGPPDTKSREWSLPSPTPATKPSGWDLGADSTAGQNNPWASSDVSKPASSQPSNPGWGTAPQNPGRGTEAAQGNASTGWGTTLQGNTNKGWGATTQVETPVQPNANPSTGWGMTAQGSNASSGWGTPAQGNSNPNTGWGAPPPQGSTVPSSGWGAPAQVNAVNPSWGGPAPGNSNPNPGWGAPAPMGTTNANGSWGAGQGNPNWGSQQDQNGEWFDRGGQGYRNSRMQSGGGGRSSSRPPPRGQGQRVGVCKFHESGYCKKGSSCNYLHS